MSEETSALLPSQDTTKKDWFNHIIFFLIGIASGIVTVTYSFTGLEPTSFSCHKDQECQDATSSGHQCQVLARLDNGTTCDVSGKVCDPDSGDQVRYNEFAMKTTIVSEFNLVCDQQYKVALVATIYMVALLLFSYPWGLLADRIGRKPTLITTLAVTAVFQSLGSFMPEYVSYTFTRFFAGAGSLGAFTIGFTLLIEVSPLSPAASGTLFHLAFASGEVVVGLVAIGLKYWRSYQLALGVPIFLLIFLTCYLPESEHWKHRSGESAERLSPLDLIKAPALRSQTVILSWNWIVITMCYYGLTMSSTNIGSDVNLTFILTVAIEIPPYFFAPWIVNHWGRKPVMVTSLLTSGICCILSGFTSGSAKVVMALLGIV